MRKSVILFLFCLTIFIPKVNAKAECLTKYPETKVNLDEEIYADSLEYLAMCVEAEARNQGKLGKIYVADCIINRYRTGKYEDFYDVINEIGQFSCVTDGHIQCTPSEETYQIVAKELEHTTNSEIKYFRTDNYHKFGTKCFSYKAHYFSK